MATRERSGALLSVLQDVDTGKMQELNTLNVTGRVCGDLAAHMTERRLGRNTLGHRVLTGAQLVSACQHACIPLLWQCLSKA